MNDNTFGLTVRGVVSDDQGRWLVLQRPRAARHCAGKWEFPGGKVGSGEPFDEALVREVREETGLDVALERLLGAAENEMPHVRVVLLFMQCRVEGAESERAAILLSDKHEAWDWVSREECQRLDLTPEAAKFRDCLLARP